LPQQGRSAPQELVWTRRPSRQYAAVIKLPFSRTAQPLWTGFRRKHLALRWISQPCGRSGFPALRTSVPAPDGSVLCWCPSVGDPSHGQMCVQKSEQRELGTGRRLRRRFVSPYRELQHVRPAVMADWVEALPLGEQPSRVELRVEDRLLVV